MVTGCIISQVSRTVSLHSLISGSRRANQHLIPHLRHCYHSLSGSRNMVIASQTGLQKPILNSNTFQRFGISTSTSPRFKVNVTSQNVGDTTDVSDDAKESTIVRNSAKTYIIDPKERKELGSNEQLSMEDMAKLVAKYNEVLKTNQEQIEQLKDRLHHTITEMEHLKERIKRKEENSKKAGAQAGEPKPLDLDQYDAIKESQRDTSAAIAYGTMIGAWVNAAHLEHYQVYYEKEESIKHKHDEPKDGKLEVEGRILTNSIKEEINNEDSGSDTSNGDSGSPTSDGDWDSYDTSNVDSGSHVSYEASGYF